MRPLDSQAQYEREWRRLWAPVKFKRYRRDADVRWSLRSMWKYNRKAA